MKNIPKLLAVASLPVAIGGWALFRPELLFIDKAVDEKAPSVTSGSSMRVASGRFASYAHETSGEAQLLRNDGKWILRLDGFKTSNGPDVHLYLVKGNDPSQSAVLHQGFVDLGTLKGNVGSQNYELPPNLDPTQYGAVAIWCKRFSVDFGGAPLVFTKPMALRTPLARWAGFEPEIRVTYGALRGEILGKAELVESNGRRFVRVSGLKIPAHRDIRVLLVKAENPKSTADVSSASKLELGVAKGGSVQFTIDDKVDAWLYRSISLWDAKAKRSLSIALLRSDQERNRAFSIA